jgi:putative toxin-antitoxin system antitoxin component (TIGR02293 family)
MDMHAMPRTSAKQAVSKAAARPARRPVKRARPQTLGLENFGELYRAAPMARIERLKQGIPAAYIAFVADKMAMSRDRLIKQLAIPRSTLERKIRSGQDLATDQAERVLGVSRLVGQVQAMVQASGDPAGFDAGVWVGQWMDQPNPALGGQRPGNLMDTVLGQELVSSVVAQMTGHTCA